MTMRAALLSVTDKTGLVDFARGLQSLGFTLISTSGTAAKLKEAGLPVTDVADVTGFAEAFEGRVKTLHPHIHGGILYRRGHERDRETAKTLGIPSIEVVAVNLYDFAGEAVARGLTPETAIEHVDIGGPAMLRAAAKNYVDVLPVCDPSDYGKVLDALKGDPFPLLRRDLAAKVFEHTARYDAMIAAYLAGTNEPLPEVRPAVFVKMRDLTYGENPHQRAALYRLAHEKAGGWQNARVLQGEKLSYNNLLDGEAALRLVHEFDSPAVAIIKHNNPCGVASGADELSVLFQRARACDPVSAFGGVVAINRPVTAAFAIQISDLFLECVLAPSFEEDALERLATKKKLRLVTFPDKPTRAFEARALSGAYLFQTPDLGLQPPSQWRVRAAGKREVPTADLCFAMTVAKHVRSNAIVIAREGQSLGIGAGQMSRVDSMRLALDKAKTHGHSLEGAVLASDGFFPFRDAIDLLQGTGIHAVIQPGGSVRDEEVMEACAELGITLVMTGRRHFTH